MNSLVYRNESYAFNIDSGYWKKIAAFAGTPRERSVSFTINGKGHVGTDYSRDSETPHLKDFWRYNIYERALRSAAVGAFVGTGGDPGFRYDNIDEFASPSKNNYGVPGAMTGRSGRFRGDFYYENRFWL